VLQYNYKMEQTLALCPHYDLNSGQHQDFDHLPAPIHQSAQTGIPTTENKIGSLGGEDINPLRQETARNGRELSK